MLEKKKKSRITWKGVTKKNLCFVVFFLCVFKEIPGLRLRRSLCHWHLELMWFLRIPVWQMNQLLCFMCFFPYFHKLYILWRAHTCTKSQCQKITRMIQRKQYSKIRRLKGSSHMLCSNNWISRPSINTNTTWLPIIRK